MINKSYAKAYAEVLKILEYVPEEDVKKIPQSKLDFYEQNKDYNYEFDIDFDKNLSEQNLSIIAKCILANIYMDYWTTPKQRSKIEEYEKQAIIKIESAKRKKYNPNNLFN